MTAHAPERRDHAAVVSAQPILGRHEQHSAAGVEVAPFNSYNFILPHSFQDIKFRLRRLI
jgi:hypothetical protein